MNNTPVVKRGRGRPKKIVQEKIIQESKIVQEKIIQNSKIVQEKIMQNSINKKSPDLPAAKIVQDRPKPKWSGIIKLPTNNIKDVDPVEVISLDGDDDESNDIIAEEDIEELSDEKNSENDGSMEVISLLDEDSSSDEDNDTPIGTARVSFLDAENRKVHKFVKISNDEDETDLVDVEVVSSDSDIEEVIESENDNRIYITIDPDDYKKVMKEKSSPGDLKKVTKSSPEDLKSIRTKNKTIQEGKKKLKKNKPAVDPLRISSVSVEDVDASDSFINNANELVQSETPDFLKGPNIPKAICCHSCSFVCFKEEELAIHIAVKHPSKAESLRTYTAAEIQELEREMRDQADDCSSCSQALWYLPTLRAHAMIHLTGQIGCEACHHGTSVIKLLMDHLESHVGSEEEEDSDL